ncbi:D-alanyl-D-alanine carboxypeptidase/D-alanyl-D-alanine endopeptidase [Tomitella biformata]|uniref:D-alanyl-D-alanine carboxypeptidase/D-alanyl-D-alanine endopeptidase n=1 Tax=Tomitella biformata TaxID=630403 RepID=UPI000465CAB6
MVASTLALLLVLAGSGIATGAFSGGSYQPAEPAPALVTASPQVEPVPADSPLPSSAALAAALAPVLANPDLGDFTGQVSDPETGEVLWQQGASTPRTPASVTKALTSSAALLTMPLDHRLTTTVVRGSKPGEVVLVGGGDPTLTATPIGQEGYFEGAAHIADLAAQIRDAGVTATSITVDVSRYSGPEMAQGWFEEDIGGGNIAPMRPVMLDGGRLDPTRDLSPRSATPALEAGRALAASLDVDSAAVALGTAPSGAEQLAAVQSQPLETLIRQAMVDSDNVLAEALGREVAVAAGKPASFSGGGAAVLGALRDAGIDTAGATLHDLSGMSVDNLLPARLLDDVFVAAAGDGQPKLRPLLDSLPIAGGTGTLVDRYGDGATGAGWVRAKTGTLSGVSTLAGIVTDVDNRVLAFALMSGGTPPELARPALDEVAEVLRGCGCR